MKKRKIMSLLGEKYSQKTSSFKLIFFKEIQRFCHKMSNIRKIYESQQITAITANTHTHEHTFNIFSARYHKHSLITWFLVAVGSQFSAPSLASCGGLR